jgi:DNA polymerase sigma
MRKPYASSVADVSAVRELHAFLTTLLGRLEPDGTALRSHDAMLLRLQAALQADWPGCLLLPYGSSVTGMSLKTSDMDVCLKVDTPLPPPRVVERLAELFTPLAVPDTVLAIPTARVPIIKFNEAHTGLAIDICINNMLPLENSALLRAYGELDPRVRPMVFAVKHFVKQRQINDPYRGSLSSYAYVLMVIHFLQTCRPPVLPCLQREGRLPTSPPVLIDHWDAYFCKDLRHLQGFGAANLCTVAQLLAQFFRFYAHEFNYREDVICVRLGEYLPKTTKGWEGPARAADEAANVDPQAIVDPTAFEPHVDEEDHLDLEDSAAAMTVAAGAGGDETETETTTKKKPRPDKFLFCIEDPFELTHNLGRMVNRFSLHTIRGEFMYANATQRGRQIHRQRERERGRVQSAYVYIYNYMFVFRFVYMLLLLLMMMMMVMLMTDMHSHTIN